MKKLFTVSVSILFIIGVFVMPATAESILEVDVIKCGDPAYGNTDNCGLTAPANDPLTWGQVEVDDSGEIRVVLIGVAANATYGVFVGNWTNKGGWQPKINLSTYGYIGTITTNDNGDFYGSIITDSGDEFVISPGTAIGQINFAFNNPPWTATQFTTGISIPLEE